MLPKNVKIARSLLNDVHLQLIASLSVSLQVVTIVVEVDSRNAIPDAYDVQTRQFLGV